MSRAFGMIVTSIWGSSKFRCLDDDTARLGYIYLHSNDHGNSIGVYRLPIGYVISDMKISEADARRIISAMCKAGLIQYDENEEVVRILNWFPHNPINNPSHLTGSLRAFFKIPSLTCFLSDVAAEIIASAWEKTRDLVAKGHDQKSADKASVRAAGERNLTSASIMFETMRDLCDHSLKHHRDDFLRAIAALPERLRTGVSTDLLTPLSPYVPGDRDTDRDTDTDTDGRQETGNSDHKTDGDDAKSLSTDREKLLEAMGVDQSAMSPSGRIYGNQADMLEAGRWASDLGLSLDQQIECIREVMTRKHDGPPASFRYFTPQMQRLSNEIRKPQLAGIDAASSTTERSISEIMNQLEQEGRI